MNSLSLRKNALENIFNLRATVIIIKMLHCSILLHELYAAGIFFFNFTFSRFLARLIHKLLTQASHISLVELDSDFFDIEVLIFKFYFTDFT